MKITRMPMTPPGSFTHLPLSLYWRSGQDRREEEPTFGYRFTLCTIGFLVWHFSFRIEWDL